MQTRFFPDPCRTNDETVGRTERGQRADARGSLESPTPRTVQRGWYPSWMLKFVLCNVFEGRINIGFKYPLLIWRVPRRRIPDRPASNGPSSGLPAQGSQACG